uniref:Protein zwilch n=1 Tax=Panagrellus redivivus TaxID=6233 RepID=A0A7E4US33_PANRE
MYALTREAFTPTGTVKVKGYRARLFNASEIPYFERPAQDAGVTEVILFDRFEPRTDLRYIDAITGKVLNQGVYKDSQDKSITDTVNESLDDSFDEKENNGLVAVVDPEVQPLQVDFLDFKKIKKECKPTHVPAQLIDPVYKFKEDLNPVTFQEASELVNLFRTHKPNIDIQLKNVWMLVATDGQDILKTLLVGWGTDGPIGAKYGSQGNAGIQLVNNSKSPVDRPASMWKAHAEYAPIKQRVFEDGSVDEDTSKVVMEVQWSSKTDIPALSAPAHNAKVTVSVYPGYMDQTHLNVNRCSDLGVLLTLNDWIVNEKADFPRADLDEEMVADVSDLLNAYKENTHKVERDFLNDLWNILRYVTSHQTLKQCFSLVMRDIKSGNLKVFMKPSYTSTIAKMCSNFEIFDFNMRPLEVLNCAHLLLEIGVDVLRVLYCLDFMNAKYISAPSVLENIMGETTLDVQQRVERLLPIHQAFVTMELFRFVLELDATWKVNVTKLVLHRFSTTKDPIHKTSFTLNIGSNYVREGVVKIADVASWTKHSILPVVSGFGADTYMNISRQLEFKHYANRVYTHLRDQKSTTQPEVLQGLYGVNEQKQAETEVSLQNLKLEPLSESINNSTSKDTSGVVDATQNVTNSILPDNKDESLKEPVDNFEPFFVVRTFISKYVFNH